MAWAFAKGVTIGKHELVGTCRILSYVRQRIIKCISKSELLID